MRRAATGTVGVALQLVRRVAQDLTQTLGLDAGASAKWTGL